MGGLANPGLPGKWPLKRCVCVCARAYVSCRVNLLIHRALVSCFGRPCMLYKLRSVVVVVVVVVVYGVYFF